MNRLRELSMQIARVYSYRRFSDPKQGKGTSLERQTAYARQLARERNMPFDDILTIDDPGLSAYHQDHITRGNFGLFLAAIKDNKVPLGSILVIEDWDRFSRAAPLEALGPLKAIVDADIAIHIQNEHKTYTKATLSDTDLLYAILGLSRAHKESKNKADRVSRAIAIRCQQWLAGEYRGPVRAGADPQWVQWNKEAGKFELIPNAARAMRKVVELFILGYGYARILRTLDSLDLRQYLGRGTLSSASALYKAMRAPYIIGTKTLTVPYQDESGVLQPGNFVLPDYYPPLITTDEYNRLQVAVMGRQRTPTFPNGKSLHPPILTGFGSTFCGYCGSPVVSQNIVRNRNNRQEESRRVRCNNYGKGSVCKTKCSCNAAPIERALLNLCSDQMNLSALVESRDAVKELEAERADVMTHLEDLNRMQNMILDASLQHGTSLPQAYIRRSQEIDLKMTAAKTKLGRIEADLLKISQTGLHTSAATWADLAQRVLDLDDEARLRCRQMINDTFARIVIYFQGFSYDPDSRYADLYLLGHNGTGRSLRIDKVTGEWVATDDYAVAKLLPAIEENAWTKARNSVF